jgi:DNA-binding CsgD family transcriptional regulator
VLEGHLVEIVLLGGIGNWNHANVLLHSLPSYSTGLELLGPALKRYCTGPPFNGLTEALGPCFGKPFVGLIATITQRAAVRIEFYNTEVTLSSAELDVLKQLNLGKSNKEIALARGRSIETVKRQVSGLFKKLGVDSRTRAILVAKERGLL